MMARDGEGRALKTSQLERLRAWLPIILAGLLVALAGSDQLSWAKTGYLTRPFLEWLYPDRNQWGITLLTFEVRKLGHVALYGLLAILVVRVVVAESRLDRLAASFVTLAIIALAGVADETRQALLPTRNGSVSDVVFDLTGAALALLNYWWVKWVVERIAGSERGLGDTSRLNLELEPRPK
jgi:VanZ family protein